MIVADKSELWFDHHVFFGIYKFDLKKILINVYLNLIMAKPTVKDKWNVVKLVCQSLTELNILVKMCHAFGV